MTLTIQIGNTDGKLDQSEWSDFVESVRTVLIAHSQIHFFGGSENWMKWQNVAWVVDIDPKKLPMIKRLIKDVRQRFRQDSVAFTEGVTLFV